MTYLHSNSFLLSDHAFTFQYGSTSIRFIQWTRRVHYKFTFQYGSTSIHSENKDLQIVVRFTFQYGSTSIDSADSSFTSSSVFTFQYGSTSIRPTAPLWLPESHLHSNMVLLQFSDSNAVFFCDLIYIPIWFYFNYFLFVAFLT